MLLNKIYNLFLLFFLSVMINAQKIISDVKIKPDNFIIETIDTVSKNIYYNYTFSTDNKNIKPKKNTITVLQVGKENTKFTDINLLKFDSLLLLYSQKEILNSIDINEILPIRKAINFYKSIIKPIKGDDYILQGRIYNKNYKFMEKLPLLKWELKENKRKILNYNCKEAIVTYKGRNWTAYYTDEIPLNNGPFVFGGLPGLILEMYDDKDEHHFVAIGIDNKQNSMYNEKDMITITKDEFYKTERNFHENPGIFINAKIYSSPNVEDKTPMKGLPYNPIELN